MFYVLLGIALLFLVVGLLVFLIDAARIHWLWAVGSLLIPVVYVVCLFKHWAATKRGFFINLFAIPFIIGAYFCVPPAFAKAVAGKAADDGKTPYFQAIERSRGVVEKVEKSREESAPEAAPTATPAPVSTTVTMAPTLPPVLTLAQRLAKNRGAFKDLEREFAALNAKRQALPKNNSKAIAAFNVQAKAYTDKLAQLRAEQDLLLGLERGASQKKP
ncbi:MAG TPA: hypothetical protein VF585_06790 [Chthoniobacterales bacterium]|jgi:hypothetical protein